ncbi:SUMF1/EgtB/PvdO family nonheme iron enzyme [Phocaeicola sp.]
MTKEGTDIHTSGGNGILADNIEYVVGNIGTDRGRSTATFTPASGNPIYYPHMDKVDFYAYYPHTAKGNNGEKLDNDYNYTIDLRDQSNPATIDLLYADKKSVTHSRTPIELSFRHVFAKVTLNVKAGDGVAAADIAAMKSEDVKVQFPNTGLVEVQLWNQGETKTSKPAVFPQVPAYKESTASDGADATFSVIVCPNNDEKTPVRFTIGDKTYMVTLDPTVPTGHWQSGNNYVYPVIVQLTGIEVGEFSIDDWKEEDKGTGTTEKPDMTDFVYIHAGTFTMGSPETESGRLTELQHQVTLTRGFYMSKYETTNEQFAAFLNAIHVGSDGTYSTNSYPSGLHPGVVLVKDCTKENDGVELRGMTWDKATSQWKPMDKCSNLPATDVTWYGADEYARWMGASLPTEAQWEYACRAGSTTAYTGGDDWEYGLGDYGWYYNNSLRSYHTQPVGTKKANAWGLYDMHGNAYEWCSDWFNYYYYESSPGKDPTGPATGNRRVIRGGTYATNPVECRSASRAGALLIDYEYLYQTGFRIVFNE